MCFGNHLPTFILFKRISDPEGCILNSLCPSIKYALSNLGTGRRIYTGFDIKKFHEKL
jgi:hypothetical protein